MDSKPVKLESTQKNSRLQQAMDKYVSPLLSRAAWKVQLAQEEFPGIIGLEVTSICNLKCPMCPRTFSPRKFGHMPLSLYERLIDQISEYDARGMIEQVALQGYGEIFLHPNWFEIIEYAEENIKNAYIRLDTNGTLMKKPVVDRLFDSHLKSLTISVDGVDETSYNLLRTGGRFQQTVENVRHFIERRKQEPDGGPIAFIQVIESDYTRQYVPNFLAYWKEQIAGASRIEVQVIQYHNFAGQIKNQVFEQTLDSGLHVNLPCYRLTYEIDVYSDGVVSVCCLDSERQIAIGNGHDKSITELWHGPEITRYRESMKKAKYDSLPLCKTCPHSQKFFANYTSPERLGRASARLAQMGRRYFQKRFFE